METQNSTASSYKTSEIGRLLGISESTVRKYQKEFDVPSWKDANGRFFSADMLPVFKQIQELRAEGLSQDEIAANIADALDEDRIRLSAKPDLGGVDMDAIVSATAQRIKSEIQAHDATFQSVVLSVLRDEYGDVREQLGSAKTQVQVLMAQLADVEQQAKLLPEKAESLQIAKAAQSQAEGDRDRAQAEAVSVRGDLRKMEQSYELLNRAKEKTEAACEALRDRNDSLEESLDRARVDNESLKKEVEALKAELDAERSRGVWARITGKK